MPCEFQFTRRVEFSDTDMAGIMHFSNFFRFMESAEHAFFRSLGHSVVLSRSGFGLHMPRVHAKCDYFAPLRFEDEVRVRLLVQKKSTRSLTYQFRFYRLHPAPSVEVARGFVTVVCARRRKDGTMKATLLPRVIADKLQQAPPELLADNGSSSVTKAAGPHSRATSPTKSTHAARRKP